MDQALKPVQKVPYPESIQSNRDTFALWKVYHHQYVADFDRCAYPVSSQAEWFAVAERFLRVGWDGEGEIMCCEVPSFIVGDKFGGFYFHYVYLSDKQGSYLLLPDFSLNGGSSKVLRSILAENKCVGPLEDIVGS